MRFFLIFVMATALFSADVVSQDTKEINIIKTLSNSQYLAQLTSEAADKYNVDPMTLAALIWSESRYITMGYHRKGSKIKGLGGIHTGIWHVPNNTPKEQIEAAAYVLRVFLDKYGNNEFRALKGYKGWSPTGERHAKYVLNKKNMLVAMNR